MIKYPGIMLQPVLMSFIASTGGIIGHRMSPKDDNHYFQFTLLKFIDNKKFGFLKNKSAWNWSLSEEEKKMGDAYIAAFRKESTHSSVQAAIPGISNRLCIILEAHGYGERATECDLTTPLFPLAVEADDKKAEKPTSSLKKRKRVYQKA
jgi:hypothetical protein